MTWHPHPMENLVGHCIESVAVGDTDADWTETTLVIAVANGGRFGWLTEGDCCSETWFADITGVSSLLGGTVSKIDEIDMPDEDPQDGRTRQEMDSVYGYRIHTDKGSGDVVFRNSSNGYYGGSIVRMLNPPSEGLRPITEDWQA